jgi:hypothetical protein
MFPEDLLDEEDLARGGTQRFLQAMYMVGSSDFCSPQGPTADSLKQALSNLGIRGSEDQIG